MDEKIYTSSPLNSTAATVVSKGIHFNPNLPRTYDTISKFPLDTVKLPKNAPKLIGTKFGRFTVIGLAPKKRNVGSWVVKCVCGNYTYRKARSISNPLNKNDCCRECMHLLYIKRNEYFRRTGKHVDIEYFFND